MSHFAELDANNVVLRVIVAEQDFIDTLPGRWVQTSFNTVKGVHKRGGTPMRKNFAGKGYTFDESRDAFIPPKPYPSWTINEQTCHWQAPAPYPADGKMYDWNEALKRWVLI